MDSRYLQCVFAAALVPCLAATEPVSAQAGRLLGVSIFEENDTFTNSDSSYTQGVRMNMSLRLPDFTDKWQWLTRCTSIVEPTRMPCGMLTFAFGQLIYTPDSINTAERRPYSRPYAGFLFIAPGAQLVQRTGGIGGRPIDISASIEVPTGLVGPGSLAKQAQSLFHWGLAHGALRPKGWEHQVAGALVINPRVVVRARVAELCYYKGQPVTHCAEPAAFRYADILASAEGALGNLQRYGQAGYVARLGWNLPSDFGPQLIPVARGIGEGDRPWYRKFTIGLHYGHSTKHVAYNRFIEGGEADESGLRTWSGIELVSDVSETCYGGYFGIGKYMLSYQKVRRGREFYAPDLQADNPALRFANITLSRAIH